MKKNKKVETHLTISPESEKKQNWHLGGLAVTVVLALTILIGLPSNSFAAEEIKKHSKKIISGASETIAAGATEGSKEFIEYIKRQEAINIKRGVKVLGAIKPALKIDPKLSRKAIEISKRVPNKEFQDFFKLVATGHITIQKPQVRMANEFLLNMKPKQAEKMIDIILQPKSIMGNMIQNLAADPVLKSPFLELHPQFATSAYKAAPGLWNRILTVSGGFLGIPIALGIVKFISNSVRQIPGILKDSEESEQKSKKNGQSGEFLKVIPQVTGGPSLTMFGILYLIYTKIFGVEDNQDDNIIKKIKKVLDTMFVSEKITWREVKEWTQDSINDGLRFLCKHPILMIVLVTIFVYRRALFKNSPLDFASDLVKIIFKKIKGTRVEITPKPETRVKDPEDRKGEDPEDPKGEDPDDPKGEEPDDPEPQAPDDPEPQAPEPQAPEPHAPEPDDPEPQAPEPHAPEPDDPEPDDPEPDDPDPRLGDPYGPLNGPNESPEGRSDECPKTIGGSYKDLIWRINSN